MKFRDYVHNNSILEIEVTNFDKDAFENDIITSDTQFSYKLRVSFQLNKPVYTGTGDFLYDLVPQFEFQVFDAVETELKGDLKAKLIDDILDRGL